MTFAEGALWPAGLKFYDFGLGQPLKGPKARIREMLPPAGLQGMGLQMISKLAFPAFPLHSHFLTGTGGLSFSMPCGPYTLRRDPLPEPRTQLVENTCGVQEIWNKSQTCLLLAGGQRQMIWLQ